MEKVIVRYKVKPGRVEENEQLIRAVYKQLHQEAPADFSYATCKLADGVSFMHIAMNRSDKKNPLAGLSAFKDFQADIKGRCEEFPVVEHVTEIGSYGWAPAQD